MAFYEKNDYTLLLIQRGEIDKNVFDFNIAALVKSKCFLIHNTRDLEKPAIGLQ
jgi:hypothetical protein